MREAAGVGERGKHTEKERKREGERERASERERERGRQTGSARIAARET